jgi:hypothetical protein
MCRRCGRGCKLESPPTGWPAGGRGPEAGVERLRAVKEVAWPDATPLEAPFVSPSAAGLRVPERPVDGELASGASRAKRRRQTPAHGEVGGAGVEDGRRGAAA